ncbi:PIGF/3-ketodihydrosphingosine reductase fusion protein-like isoform X1 [Rutidosis leptorrhynchoides]|uniref:PIGF/3-ketodihydrosphingosine reductase fusion protein-like isoform X1 n=1 Tax=Rutidosis leptorrhynchoides TaxID=125765 RepID=UPI003A99A30B
MKSKNITGVQNLSPSKVFVSHLSSGIALASSFWLAVNVFSINLIDHPSETLRLISLIEIPVVILVYSIYRKDKYQSSYLKAVARGLLGVPVGAAANALGAIALGAPVGTQYFQRTLNWSLMMSAFTVVPAACVYGSSWVDWHRIFAHTTYVLDYMNHSHDKDISNVGLVSNAHPSKQINKPIESIDYMICLPAHGAIIGAWFGAWPMPLDWERAWQEWPISVTYGAIIGYLVGLLASFSSVLFHHSRQHVKGD